MQNSSTDQAPYKNLTGASITLISEPCHTSNGWYTKAYHPDLKTEIFILWKGGLKPTENDLKQQLYICQERKEQLPVYGCAA